MTEKTLRDEFAMAALFPLMLTVLSKGKISKNDDYILRIKAMVAVAYDYADAMLAERMK